MWVASAGSIVPTDLGQAIYAARLSELQHALDSAIGRYITECLARSDRAAAPEMRDVWLQHAADAETALRKMQTACKVWWNEYIGADSR